MAKSTGFSPNTREPYFYQHRWSASPSIPVEKATMTITITNNDDDNDPMNDKNCSL
jgi:hypothetical protein